MQLYHILQKFLVIEPSDPCWAGDGRGWKVGGRVQAPVDLGHATHC